MKRNHVFPRQKSLVVPEIQNPFVLNQKLSFLDKLQIAFMSVTIAPIRLVLIVLLLLLAWPFAKISIACRSSDRSKPATGWRLFLRPLVLLICRGVFTAGGLFYVKTKGKQASSKEAPVLLLSPHSSFLDALPVVFCGLTSVVAKASTQNIAIFGTLIEFSQPVLVRREDPDSRVNTIKEIQRRGQSGGQWPQIIIFPEGTCTNRSCLISFKQGAFTPGVPVQPVCIKYNNKLDTVTWTWEGPGALAQLWYTLCQFYTNIEIHYLDVYIPNEAEKADAKLFASNVREVMADHLGVPVTDLTYDDCRLMETAMKMNMPGQAGLMEFEKLHKKLGYKYDEMTDLLVKLKDDIKAPNSRNMSNISFDDFCNYLLLPKSDVLREVFNLYDRDGSGKMDFREYVIGLSLVLELADNAETISLAFKLFDSNNKGQITQDNLQQILTSAFKMDPSAAEHLFKDVTTATDGKITTDEFKAYAIKKPEYAQIFVTYQELKTSLMNQGTIPTKARCCCCCCC